MFPSLTRPIARWRWCAALPWLLAAAPVWGAKTAWIVESPAVAGAPEWKAVSDALAEKWRRQGMSVVRRTAMLPRPLSAGMSPPDYVAFVRRPQECGFAAVAAMNRAMRALDPDPFEDAPWGVVSGAGPETARRLAEARPPDLSSVLSTTGVDDRRFAQVFTISDANPPGTIFEKTPDGACVKRQMSGDTTAEFAAAWRRLNPGVVVTSAHASERNLEMPFSRGNIVADRRGLWLLPDRQLIDYCTGQATGIVAKVAVPLPRPHGDRIWLAPGNCLIAHAQDGDSFVWRALDYGRSIQFFGYALTTWHGAVGWGTFGRWQAGGVNVAEARRAAVNAMLSDALEICPGLDRFDYAAATPAEFAQGFQAALAEFLAAEGERTTTGAKRTDADWRRLAGALWDRDATVLFGDPALAAVLPPGS